MSALRAAVLIDRDGVVTEPVYDPRSATHESPYRPEDVRLVPGAAAAIKALQASGWLVAVVSNQPAAAKGTATLAELQTVHERVVERLADVDVALESWHYCHHHPDGVVAGLAGSCGCRKPAPGLLVAAATRLGATLQASWMVGDSASDVGAGRRAGCRTALVEHPLTTHRRARSETPDLRAQDLVVAGELISGYGSLSRLQGANRPR